MIYPENFENKIGIDKVRGLVLEKCLSPMGEEKVNEMMFSADYDHIVLALEQTNELLQVIQNKESFPTECFFDLRDSLLQVERQPDFWLSEQAIPRLANSLSTIIDIVKFINDATTESGKFKYPRLKAMSDKIRTFPVIVEQANSILDKSGHIKDSASKLLAEIRRGKIEANKEIARNMQTAIRSAQAQGLIARDVQPDMREGHYIIPVNASYKRKIKGVIRNDSGSGKTVYIEPEAVVEASNRLRELEGDERMEIARILAAFTNGLRPDIEALKQSYNFLGEVDFIRAKALFANRINGIKPKVENVPQIEWIQAVHPLLNITLRQENKKAHPLDIRLTKEDRLLIISGVNAGGKSLCLKTVALLQYMLQCGMLIPVAASSGAGLFEHVFMDIGDGQSMENSLSTYTAHLTNMKFFVENNDDKTLLLIDEFGGGTEPQIGGAIAESLLERFNNKGSFGVITSHFQNLKDFAYKTDGIINGAMLYDAVNERPLYQLSIGSPGSSFAVEVARRIGLPEDIILSATEKMGEDFIHMDNFLQSIARDKLYWERKRKEMGSQVINQQEDQHVKMGKKQAAELPATLKKALSRDQIKTGDIVSLKGQTAKGRVLAIKGKQATVAFGSINSKVAITNLEFYQVK